MKKYISRLHYITQDSTVHSHIEQAQIACENGINWIQYRCLNKPEEEQVDEIHHIASICDDWGATLILTNQYHLLDQVDAQGVYIEDINADFATIREQISDEKTLGASAHDLNNLQKLQATGVVDYCGYGQFAKSNSENQGLPLLGFNGYRELEKLRINIAVIATGGIRLTDVEHLLNLPIDGIAVSSAINNAPDMASAAKAFYQSIY